MDTARNSTPAAAARSEASETIWSSTGSARVEPSDDDRASALQLAEEEDVVDQLADLLDLAVRLRRQRVGVGTGQRSALSSSDHQPGERRP